MLRVVFQDFKEACLFWSKLGQLELVCCNVLNKEHNLISFLIELRWSSVRVGTLDLAVLCRVKFF